MKEKVKIEKIDKFVEYHEWLYHVSCKIVYRKMTAQ